MKKLIVANWKLYVNRSDQALKLLKSTVRASKMGSGVKIVICAPFLMVPTVNAIIKGSSISTGAQNLSEGTQGAFTGEVSAHLLKDYGVEYVIIGHSERRYIFDETDEVVAQKLIAASKEGLKPILCVGEQKRIGNWKKTLLNQVSASIKGLDKKYIAKLIIAYEPVWAIGTGNADTPQDAKEAIIEIRKVLARRIGSKAAANIRMLYGGSVTSKNIANFISSAEIGGALIGRASTNPKDFALIIKKTALLK